MTAMMDRSYYRQLRRDGLTVQAAVRGVRQYDMFRSRLASYVAAGDKRSRAAKKGWKTRRANLKKGL
jgi:hypothetical protein